MQKVNIGRPDPDQPIEWTPYQGEEVIMKMVIRK